ncbi:MAG: hypothetical protein AAB966_03490 [Patescibacteria group bacterium]
MNNENINTLSESGVEKINSSYVRSSDKWHRMCAGLASNLERYENGIIYLKIENTEKQFPSNIETARMKINGWINGNKELRQAKGFVVTFYTTKFTGIMLSLKDTDEGMVKEIAEEISSAIKYESELINVFSGLL